MSKILKAFAGTFAGLVLLFTPLEASAAVPPAEVSICKTGSRSDAEYRRKCMTHGTVLDAAHLWYSTPVGRKGKESRYAFDRRSICKHAVQQYGSFHSAVNDLFFDVTYDNFRNDGKVRRMIIAFASHDCRAMGYRI